MICRMYVCASHCVVRVCVCMPMWFYVSRSLPAPSSLCKPPANRPTMAARKIAGIPRLGRFCVERKRPSPLEHYSSAYTRKCKEFCGEQFRKMRSYADVVAVMKETERKARKIRRKKGTNTLLRRNKRASAAELRGMTLAFVQRSAEHAASAADGICLPIREPAAPCKACARHRCTIASMDVRIKELESRNVIELAAQKFVDEAKQNVKDTGWESARRRLMLIFHPDKMNLLCPAAGTAFVKAFSTHRQW